MKPMAPTGPPPARGARRYLPAMAVVGLLALIGGIASAVSHHSSASLVTGSGTSSLPLTFAQAQDQHRTVDFGPKCDPATGRIRVPSAYAPPCVAPFNASNGGSTSPGVTASTITVAFYAGANDLLQEGILAGGGTADTPEQIMATVQDYVDYFQAHYETYGRKIKLVKVEASGAQNDDAAGKADAIKVATEIKAFASFGGPTQTDAYAQELAARHVLCIGCTTGLTDAAIRGAAPYLWGFQPSPEEYNVITAEYVAKRLNGGVATYAGDAGMQRRQRVFGLLAYDTPTGSFGPVRDDLAHKLSARGVTLAATASYALDVSRAQELATTLVAKMKSAGVTTVIFDGDPFAPVFLTKEATNQGYFPEWIVTGSTLTDTAAFSRVYDQRQWSHAFGVSELPGRVHEADIEPFLVHEWAFATPPKAGSTYSLIYPNPLIFFTGVHLAGPHLTPESFRDGLFSFPPSGGGQTTALLSFGRHGLWPNDDYLGFDDVTEIWWDPKAPGEDEIGRKGGIGLYRYVDGGRRYRAGQLPSGPPTPFIKAGTVTIYGPPEGPPRPDPPPAYPRPTPLPPH